MWRRRRRRGLTQVLLEVLGRLERSIRTERALRQVQEHGRMLAERIRLEEGRAGGLVLSLVEPAHAFLEASSRFLGGRVVGLLSEGGPRGGRGKQES